MSDHTMAGQPEQSGAMSKPHEIDCWKCGEQSTLKTRFEFDGCCWACGEDIDLEDYLVRAMDERDQLRAEVEALRVLLIDARELIGHGDFREGHCMCGSAVEGHTFGDGHTPCDAGEYYAGQVRERIDAALAEKLEKAAVALKTIGSGRPDGINVSEAPVGHARPATPPPGPPNKPTHPDAAPAAPVVQDDEPCTHEFVMFQPDCTKCGQPYAAPVADPDAALVEALKELVSAVRSINRSRRHQIRLPVDSEPVYWQRKAWIDRVLGLADSADAALAGKGGAQPAELNDDDLNVVAWNTTLKDGFDMRRGSAVSITHIPTGISVMRDSERSQYANKEAALAVLTKLVAAMAGKGGE